MSTVKDHQPSINICDACIQEQGQPYQTHGVVLDLILKPPISNVKLLRFKVFHCANHEPLPLLQDHHYLTFYTMSDNLYINFLPPFFAEFQCVVAIRRLT